MKPTRPYLESVLPNIELGSEADAPDVRPSRSRNLWTHLGEGVLAVVLTLACFVALLVLLTRTLPSATGLGELIAESHTDLSALQPSGIAGALQDAEGWRFTLSVLDNEVMRKRASSIAWQPTRSGAALEAGDGIQTTREGMAIVALDPKNRMRIGRNSLVVLQHQELSSADQPRTPASFSVVSGELWGDFSASPPVAVEVPAGASTARVSTEADRGRSEFKVTVLNGEGSAVAVFRGAATVGTGAGSVSVHANEYVVVDSTGVTSAPMRLLDPPELVTKSERPYVYRDFPPAMAFQWQKVSGADEYRILISKDEDFTQIVLDERTDQESFMLGSLTAGTYWWRVSSLLGAVDGRASAAARVNVIQDREPPVLNVSFPEARTRNASVTIEGRAEPGTRVFVAGEPASVQGDGRFRKVASLKPGVNLIVVEAIDEAGNTAYDSREIERVSTSGGESVP